MQNPTFVSNLPPENQAKDFKFLKKEGIKFIQALTGAFWTDYNEHDPGVTILEQLCYALTDLAYRTDFPIQDLLFTDSEEDAIFPEASNILSNQPVTMEDFRKVILDKIPELKNIWFKVTPESETSLRGLYQIYAELDNAIAEIKDEEIVKKISDIYAHYRNLCEDVDKIEIAKPVPVSIYASIEVDTFSEPEEVLAQIYYTLDQNLNPEVPFYTLKELMQAGKSINEIFEGVLLEHGFIQTADLHEKTDKILMSDITKTIMQVSGVVSIKNLSMSVNDVVYNNQLILQDNQVAKLIFGSNVGKDDFTIQFYKGNLPYTQIDSTLVKRRYNELQSAKKRVYGKTETSLEIKKGQKMPLIEYFSLQNQFPIVYGIGDEGIPNQPDAERKAQAKQLKGYLMIFEQILANYLAQLANVKNLFSPNESIKQTYFFQTLDAVPNGKELVANNYVEGLAKINQEQDDFLTRRNRFLDFFLAVHGESYEQYAQAQRQQYKSEDAFAQYQIASKTYFLGKFEQLSQNRSQAFNYTIPTLGRDNFSGMERRLMILLGLGFKLTGDENDDREKYFIQNLIFDNNTHWQIWDTINERNLLAKWQKKYEINYTKNELLQYFDWIDDVDVPQFLADDKDVFLEKMNLWTDKIMPTHLIGFGSDLKNYRIGNFNDKWVLLFYFQEKNYFFGEYETEINALEVLKAWISLLEEFNFFHETMHVLEHILMRPSEEDRKFGFYIVDENRKPVLKSEKCYSFKERQKIMEILNPYLFENKNYSVERREDGDFEIQLTIPNQDVMLTSLEKNISVQVTHEKLERLEYFLADKHIEVPFQEKIAYYIQYENSEIPIAEEFFNYQISVVMPNWTNRFSIPAFHGVVENMIQECTPANIFAQNVWLSVSKMQKFEEIYKKWLLAKQSKSSDLEIINNECVLFLYKAILEAYPHAYPV